MRVPGSGRAPLNIMALPDGLYDLLLTESLRSQLTQAAHRDHHTLQALSGADASQRLNCAPKAASR